MPAYGNFVLDKGKIPEAAVTKFRFVKQGTAEDGCIAVTTSADNPLGVAQHSATAGEVALGKRINVRTMGISECEAAGAITRGNPVTIATDGRVKAAATGERVVGQALQTASGAGVRIAVHLDTAKQLSP